MVDFTFMQHFLSRLEQKQGLYLLIEVSQVSLMKRGVLNNRL